MVKSVISYKINKLLENLFEETFKMNNYNQRKETYVQEKLLIKVRVEEIV